MSVFTDYDDVSSSYDMYRRASNMDLILAMSTHLTGKCFKDMSVLDAGCGTGNYSLGFLNAGVGNLTMLDASVGMLKAAKAKMSNYDNNVNYCLDKLPSLPFQDETFDVVMFMQVLHHLDNTTHYDSRFPTVRQSLVEAVRVLKKGGVVVIDTSSVDQLKYGIWFHHLLGISETYSRRMPPISLLRQVLQDGGCTVQSYIQPEHVLMDYAMYCDLEGALEPSWRRADSSFSHATQEQIDEFCEKIVNMKNANTLQEFFQECEKSRLKFGQTTTIFACKSEDNDL